MLNKIGLSLPEKKSFKEIAAINYKKCWQMLTFVLKKAKFYQGCRFSFMSLLKINTFGNISQTFDHISDHKFKAVSFSK